MGAAEPTRLARCPRCGYDQRGVIDTWNESCPLAGTCTECGLEFRWAEVLSEKIRRPRWCVEFADETSTFIQRSLCTFLLTYWPWRFWKSLKMSHEIRWRRLAAYLFLMLASLYVMFCVAHGAIVYSEWNALIRTGGWTWGSIDWLDIARAMLLPLSGKSPVGPATGFPSPGSLFDEHWPGPLRSIIAVFPVFHGLCVAGFIALPVSRRRAKVRWSHIFRIALYGMAFIAPMIALFIVGKGLSVLGPPFLAGLIMAASVLAALAILPLEVIWWSTATGRYLKIPHAWGVGLAIVVMAFLGTLVCAWAGLF